MIPSCAEDILKDEQVLDVLKMSREINRFGEPGAEDVVMMLGVIAEKLGGIQHTLAEMHTASLNEVTFRSNT